MRAFSSDRERLVTGSRTGAVEIWDLRNGKKLRTFGDHTGGVLSVAYSGDGRLVLSVGSDNSVRVYGVATGKQLGTLESDHTQVRCVAFSPDSRRALSGDLYGLVHLWDLATGKEVCRLAGHTMAVNAVAFSPDGRRAVSGSDDRTVRLWQLPESGAVGDTSSNKSAQPPTQTSVAAPPVAATIVESTSPVTPAAAKPADPPKSGTKVTGDPAESITNAIGMKLALIPAGEFLMGSSKDEDNDAYDNELPRHRVRITRPFFLGVTEVTQGQYRAVTGQSPSHFKGSDDLPVESVSWLDAVKFCNALSLSEAHIQFYPVVGHKVDVPDWKGLGYRLPTEAEWEYACRAKNPMRYSFGDDPASLDGHAWVDSNSGGLTHPVGTKKPNRFGLFDMHGSVWEWCSDGFANDFYARSPANDPVGPLRVSERVIRGGSWTFDAILRGRRTGSRTLPTIGITSWGFASREASLAPSRREAEAGSSVEFQGIAGH